MSGSIFLDVVYPLTQRVKEIHEGLYKKDDLQDGLYFGKLDENYEKFKLRRIKTSEDYSFNNYLIELEKELNSISNTCRALNKSGTFRVEALFKLILDCESRIIELRETSQSIQNKTTNNRNRRLLTYEWTGKKEEIKELYDALTDTFIDKRTNFEQFKVFLSGVPIEQLSNKIIWKSNNATELLFFIKSLEELGLVKKSSTNMNYDQIKACFVKTDGDPFNEKFKVLKTNIEIRLNQNKQDLIIRILEAFR